MTFRTEFPDLPLADFPTMPPGFTDSSWHNDACPSMKNEAIRVLVFIEYADPAMREVPMAKRFMVQFLNADGVVIDGESITVTDDWAEVLALIASKGGPQ